MSEENRKKIDYITDILNNFYNGNDEFSELYENSQELWLQISYTHVFCEKFIYKEELNHYYIPVRFLQSNDVFGYFNWKISGENVIIDVLPMSYYDELKKAYRWASVRKNESFAEFNNVFCIKIPIKHINSITHGLFSYEEIKNNQHELKYQKMMELHKELRRVWQETLVWNISYRSKKIKD